MLEALPDMLYCSADTKILKSLKSALLYLLHILYARSTTRHGGLQTQTFSNVVKCAVVSMKEHFPDFSECGPERDWPRK